jgi:transcription elongation factor GreA
MNELEYKISNADVIDPNKLPKDKAVFGSRVRLENVDTGEDVEYQLVGPEESNIEEGRISVSSPLGKALLGKKPDDEITVQAPAGRRVYELIEIR